MYRQFISQEEYDEIVNEYIYSDNFPHCNQTMFHSPGVCAFCDGYYKGHPGFMPPVYEFADANGWGGNMAPIIDDVKAAEEQVAIKKFWDDLTWDIPVAVPVVPNLPPPTVGRRFMNWITRQ